MVRSRKIGLNLCLDNIPPREIGPQVQKLTPEAGELLLASNTQLGSLFPLLRERVGRFLLGTGKGCGVDENLTAWKEARLLSLDWYHSLEWLPPPPVDPFAIAPRFCLEVPICGRKDTEGYCNSVPPTPPAPSTPSAPFGFPPGALSASLESLVGVGEAQGPEGGEFDPSSCIDFGDFLRSREQAHKAVGPTSLGLCEAEAWSSLVHVRFAPPWGGVPEPAQLRTATMQQWMVLHQYIRVWGCRFELQAGQLFPQVAEWAGAVLHKTQAGGGSGCVSRPGRNEGYPVDMSRVALTTWRGTDLEGIRGVTNRLTTMWLDGKLPPLSVSQKVFQSAPSLQRVVLPISELDIICTLLTQHPLPDGQSLTIDLVVGPTARAGREVFTDPLKCISKVRLVAHRDQETGGGLEPMGEFRPPDFAARGRAVGGALAGGCGHLLHEPFEKYFDGLDDDQRQAIAEALTEAKEQMHIDCSLSMGARTHLKNRGVLITVLSLLQQMETDSD